MAHTPKSRKKAYAKMKALRAEFFADKYCVVCGSTENMELDHIDRSTKIDHRIWTWAPARRALEIEKCQVLCRLCHIEKTRLEVPEWKTKPLIHGTKSGYYKGCRCVECTREHSEEIKEWKRRTNYRGITQS